MRTVAIFAIFVTVLLFSGCAHYDPIVIEQLSNKTQYADEITEDMCEDFYTGARAFAEGPERAYPWFGRAREIDDANVVMRKQGVVCYSAESRELSDKAAARILEAFKRTWREAEGVAK
jgi:hypothetical protein